MKEATSQGIHYTKFKPNLLDLRFPRRWLWRMPSSNLSSSQFIKANKLQLPKSNISGEPVALLLLIREVRRQSIRPFTQMPEQFLKLGRRRFLPYSLRFVGSWARTSVARLYSVAQMKSYMYIIYEPRQLRQSARSLYSSLFTNHPVISLYSFCAANSIVK
jgi:hypothetical protein